MSLRWSLREVPLYLDFICTFQDPEVQIQNERIMKYKLIELQNMALYWDTDVTLVGNLPSQDLEVCKKLSKALMVVIQMLPTSPFACNL